MKLPNTQLLFVVVTPSYNQAKYIKQTIKSVLSQRVQIKYWVIDGGSTDQTVNILKSFKQQIQWQSQKDRGQTDAINKGLKLIQQDLSIPAKQVIFAYLNSDDYYLAQALETVHKVFITHPDVKWVVGDAIIVDQKGRAIQHWIKKYKQVLRWLYQPWFLTVLNPLPQPATFVRWSAIQQVGRFNDKLHYVMDYDYWFRLQAKFGQPFFIDQPLAAFRIHTDSKGGSQYLQQFKEQWAVAKQYSTNQLLLLMHRLHNWLTITIYQFIK